MWEYFLVLLNLNVVFVLSLSKGFFFKIILVYLNHLYISLLFISLLFLQRIYLIKIIQLFIVYFSYKIYFLEIQNFFLLKHIFNLITLHNFFFNLLIGLVLIHPPLFYIGTILWLQNLMWIFFKSNLFVYNLYLITSNLIFVLGLGGFWGWLNFSWGFYWVYDYIEYLLLFLILSNLYCLHIKNYKQFIWNKNWWFVCLFLLYIMIRYSLLPSRHTFFTKLTSTNFKNILVILHILNFPNLICFISVIISFFKIKFWSFFLSYFGILSIIWFLFNEHGFTNLFFFYKHLIFFFIFFFLILHTSNYYYFITYKLVKNYLNLTYLSWNYMTPQTLWQINWQFFIRYKRFISNFFYPYNTIFAQIINKNILINQLNCDIYLIYLSILIILIVCII